VIETKGQLFKLQMEKEIKELIQQRDLAQARVEDLLRVVGSGRLSSQWVFILFYNVLNDIHVSNEFVCDLTLCSFFRLEGIL